MELIFDISTVEYTEFGVGRDQDNSQVFHAVRVAEKAREALHEMVVSTWNDMEKSVEGSPTQTEFEEVNDGASVKRFVTIPDYQTMQNRLEGGPQSYSPSEKYSGTEYLYLPLNDNRVSQLRDLYTAVNLPSDSQLLDDTDSVFCYFTRMRDSTGRRITAIRRATGFKGMLKSKLLASLTGDALDLISANVFKLDNDFDILIDSENVHIWRPNSFESVGKLKQDILDAVPENIESIKQDIDFVDFETISEYASAHIMAARYLASIRVQASEGAISKNALLTLCKFTGVEVEEEDGIILVAYASVIGFLEVLDRRRYGIELIEGHREQFRATSRRRIN